MYLSQKVHQRIIIIFRDLNKTYQTLVYGVVPLLILQLYDGKPVLNEPTNPPPKSNYAKHSLMDFSFRVYATGDNIRTRISSYIGHRIVLEYRKNGQNMHTSERRSHQQKERKIFSNFDFKVSSWDCRKGSPPSTKNSLLCVSEFRKGSSHLSMRSLRADPQERHGNKLSSVGYQPGPCILFSFGCNMDF